MVTNGVGCIFSETTDALLSAGKHFTLRVLFCNISRASSKFQAELLPVAAALYIRQRIVILTPAALFWTLGKNDWM